MEVVNLKRELSEQGNSIEDDKYSWPCWAWNCLGFFGWVFVTLLKSLGSYISYHHMNRVNSRFHGNSHQGFLRLFFHFRIRQISRFYGRGSTMLCFNHSVFFGFCLSRCFFGITTWRFRCKLETFLVHWVMVSSERALWSCEDGMITG